MYPSGCQARGGIGIFPFRRTICTYIAECHFPAAVDGRSNHGPPASLTLPHGLRDETTLKTHCPIVGPKRASKRVHRFGAAFLALCVPSSFRIYHPVIKLLRRVAFFI